jgi:hypothetical protein
VVAVSETLQALLDQHRVDLGGLSPGEWLQEMPGVSEKDGGETVPFALPARPTGIRWANMLIPQAGAGTNTLRLDHALPEELFTVWLALPVATFREQVGLIGMRGWEVVLPAAHQPQKKPMPDCVVLHQTAPRATLKLAEHAREPYLALSLGLEWRVGGVDSNTRLADVHLVHADAKGRAAGGFVLRPAFG